MPIITDQNIVPLVVSIGGTIVAILRANKAQSTAVANHAETLAHIKRLDDHNDVVGATAIAALADSVPITSIPALTAAVQTPPIVSNVTGGVGDIGPSNAGN